MMVYLYTGRERWKMEYTVVRLKEKIVVGLSARTKNSAPDMSRVIGGLWNDFFNKEIYTMIPNKVSSTSIGLYDGYESDMSGAYDVTVCTEVSEFSQEIPEGCVLKRIPAGEYALFQIEGNRQTAVIEFWKELWKLPLKRSYKADFEEYIGGTPEQCKINIYIAL